MPIVGAGPLPARLLSFTAADGELVPAWLTDRDRPWLRDLHEEVAAATGSPIAALARRWRLGEPDPRAGARAGIAQHVVLALLRRQPGPPKMGALRAALFRLVASGVPRDEALARVAAPQHLAPEKLAAALFSDLPHERRVRDCEPPLEPSRLALLANQALVQGLLLHAESARLELRGASRAVLRTAWLLGAGLVVDAADGDTAHLHWRATSTARPRALAALVPLLPWARRFTLRARCRLRAVAGELVLATGDPLPPGREPRRYDSALERRFAREFAACSDWELLREPAPLRLAEGLAFPDFAVRRAADGATFLLEIAGLRDRTAMPAKLELLQRASHLVLALPHHLVPAELRGHPRVVPFGRHLAVDAVLAALARIAARSAARLPMASP